MANFRRHTGFRATFAPFASILLLLVAGGCPGNAQQQTQGFAVERFYPSAPGCGWFVMGDVNISGGLGGVLSFTSGYSRNPFEVTGPDGTGRLALITNQAFVDVAGAVTYDRYRFYFDLPVPLVVSGNSGTLGPYQLTAPSLNVGMNPDTISDPRIGFDMRLLGTPGGVFRLGAGAQLIIPSGDRADYVTDARYRGMFRLLPAGNIGRFSYAGQLGLHVRPVEGSLPPGGPTGNELLFGVSGGYKFSVGNAWSLIVGPELFGETGLHSLFRGPQTGFEGLFTSRLERPGDKPHLRLKLGIGHGIVENFGAPKWRALIGLELAGQRRDAGGASGKANSRTSRD